MQPLELAVTVFGAVTVIVLFALNSRKVKAKRGLGAIVLVLTITQLYFEGYRWQMAGAYLSVALIFAALLGRSRMRTLTMRCLAGSSLVGFAASVTAATFFPVFKFPALTGHYQVGTVVLEFPKGLSKGGSSVSDAGERKLVVQLFYPAEPSAEQRSRYTLAGLSTRFKPQLRRVQTLAVVNATFARSGQPYPVIIYSHSWNGSRLENIALVQELASHGYVVACVDDTEYTPETVFANGTVRRHAGERWLDFSSPNLLQESMQRLRKQLDGRVEDVSFVLDQLIWLNKTDTASQFYQRLNTDRAGTLGFSFGGTTTAQACRVDQRFKAGVNLDGYAFTVADATAIRQPFLSMTESAPTNQEAAPHDPARHAEWSYDMVEYQHISSSIQSNGGYYLTVKGTRHLNFSDFPFYSPLRSYTGAGPIEPHRAISIISSYTVSFFDQSLRDEPSPLLQTSSPDFPEVAFVLGQKTETTLIH